MGKIVAYSKGDNLLFYTVSNWEEFNLYNTEKIMKNIFTMTRNKNILFFSCWNDSHIAVVDVS